MSRIMLVGCGKMGGALLDGWLKRDVAAADVLVIEPNAIVTARPGLQIVKTAAEIPATFKPDVVLIAVKPQKMDEAVPALARYSDAVYLSIAAGRTHAYFARVFGPKAAVVRSMPNTPAAVGRGITVAVANAHVTAAQRRTCDALLAAVGEVVWTEDEATIDVATAVSGGGPAYVFLLAEVLADAGVAAGLSRDLADRLALSLIHI